MNKKCGLRHVRSQRRHETYTEVSKKAMNAKMPAVFIYRLTVHGRTVAMGEATLVFTAGIGGDWLVRQHLCNLEVLGVKLDLERTPASREGRDLSTPDSR